ncbi:hypothetical protein DICPUDRAFT_152066 [Dictyostelium purpureum]|uniref:Uncharacterized protein n=1 Tax=Dictyostelium purpureum TaxID=5786 RepID=F0ZKE0_DICPU|nr:uncharacterized protein DICPUDRAFT_152066 [Dictyostelium purpureum]EGC35576.1 hypothetical protein DICPUDRAFT_152066 [Dictyostelium purpureum]|eukprot:XP_003287879.1 hypothetical protein DICPUDRAFT_152066 [Dictyostelium purpureum]
MDGYVVLFCAIIITVALSFLFGMGAYNYYFNNNCNNGNNDNIYYSNGNFYKNDNGNHHPNLSQQFPQYSDSNSIQMELQKMLLKQQKEQQLTEKQKAIAELIRLRELKLQR